MNHVMIVTELPTQDVGVNTGILGGWKQRVDRYSLDFIAKGSLLHQFSAP